MTVNPYPIVRLAAQRAGVFIFFIALLAGALDGCAVLSLVYKKKANHGPIFAEMQGKNAINKGGCENVVGMRGYLLRKYPRIPTTMRERLIRAGDSQISYTIRAYPNAIFCLPAYMGRWQTKFLRVGGNTCRICLMH
jgi:hypothetical protein